MSSRMGILGVFSNRCAIWLTLRYYEKLSVEVDAGDIEV